VLLRCAESTIPTLKRYVTIFYFRRNILQLKFCISLDQFIVCHTRFTCPAQLIPYLIALIVIDGEYVFIQYATGSGLMLFIFRRNTNNRLLGDEIYTGTP
jgi:hypothetical protein